LKEEENEKAEMVEEAWKGGKELNKKKIQRME